MKQIREISMPIQPQNQTSLGISFGKKRTMNSERRAESLWSTIMRVNTISGFPRSVPLGLFGSGQHSYAHRRMTLVSQRL